MKNEEFAAAIGKIYMFACACVALLTACSGSDATPSDGPATPHELQPATVSFATEVAREQTRATTGLINNLKGLQAMGEGFGVFAYLTDDKTWAGAKAADTDLSEFKNFFMQNQQVTWGVQWVDDKGDTDPANDENQYDWVYYPLKYWPNSTDNATARYVSFFAYAPWADATTRPEAGVINYVRDGDRLPHVIYKLGAPNQQVDLLWAKAVDTKRNGNGLISVGRNKKDTEDSLLFQKVPLEFHHALSAIDIYVQRVYDEPAYTGKVPSVLLYPTIYISKMELKSTTKDTDGKNMLQTSGRLNLETGEWTDYSDTWSGETPANAWTTGDVTLTYDETMLNDTLRGTTSTDPDVISDTELDKWKWVLDTKNTASTADDEWVDATAIPESELTKPANKDRWKDAYGVSEVERNLIKNTMTQVLIPRKVTLIPTLTYSMVVRDDALRVDYLTDSEGHKYTRIINEVPGNSVTLDLVAGKRYTLLIRIGVEHISFELVSVVDWDFPMRFTPDVVSDFEKDEIGHILNE